MTATNPEGADHELEAMTRSGGRHEILAGLLEPEAEPALGGPQWDPGRLGQFRGGKVAAVGQQNRVALVVR